MGHSRWNTTLLCESSPTRANRPHLCLSLTSREFSRYHHHFTFACLSLSPGAASMSPLHIKRHGDVDPLYPNLTPSSRQIFHQTVLTSPIVPPGSRCPALRQALGCSPWLTVSVIEADTVVVMWR
jgi:hypothetical protein